MSKTKTEIIIVGSGIGGATVAKELAKKGKKVLILEKGRHYDKSQIGTELSAYDFYDRHGLWSKTKEGVFYYRTIMVGGTSIVSCGNGVRSLESQFKKMGQNLAKEFRETERDLHIKPVPERFLGPGTRRIMAAAKKFGIKMVPMPKYIDFKKCISCGNCVVGCRSGAKWTALEYLEKAQKKGANLLTGITVTKVLTAKGRAIGVEGIDKTSRRITISGNTVILAAGGIGTPIILQNSGIFAGKKLFLDLFNVTMGITSDIGSAKEVTMAAVCHYKGFILSPFVDNLFATVSTVPLPLRRNLKLNMHRDRIIGIMAKIKDDCVGKVRKDGVIEKTVTRGDFLKLNDGKEISKKILIEAGADPDTILTTKIRGAHPGGTAAIGEVVNKDLETKIKGLYLCDASVLPEAPGLPPIVTIIALAKRFAKHIAKKI